MPVSDDQLDALLKASEEAGEDPIMIHARLNERKRKRDHAKAKAAQPSLAMKNHLGKAHDALCETLRREFMQPLLPEDCNPGGMDMMLLTLRECLQAGELEDALFQLVRIARRAWAGNRMHMEPIEGAPKYKPGDSL